MTNKLLVKSTGTLSRFYGSIEVPALGVIITYFRLFIISFKTVKTGSLVNQKSDLQPSTVCNGFPIVPVLFTNSLNKE
jgi:hypothetical protein